MNSANTVSEAEVRELEKESGEVRDLVNSSPAGRDLNTASGQAKVGGDLRVWYEKFTTWKSNPKTRFREGFDALRHELIQIRKEAELLK